MCVRSCDMGRRITASARPGATSPRRSYKRLLARFARRGYPLEGGPAGLNADWRMRCLLACPRIRAVGVAIIAAILLAIGSPAVAPAATMEEVSRCRAMRNHIQRWDCFKSLKEGPKAKATDAPKAGAEDSAKAKTGNTPSPPAPDASATTSAIDHLSVTPGQPLCVDRDALAAILAAGAPASSPAEATTNGCQAIPEDAKVELLERYPNGLRFLRVIKVKVTSPALPDSTVGFTIETGR